MNETRTLAKWAASLQHRNLPDEVCKRVRLFILDNLACQIAGATLPWSRTFWDVIRRTRSGTHSTVVFYGRKLSPDEAAFLNSAFNHANEMDDTHLKCPTHPGQIAVPAALAMAEFSRSSGKRMVVAIAASYELQIRIAWACSPYLSQRGHHPPVGVGPFGAAVASGIALGFDAGKMLNALAISGSHSAGLSEYTRAGGSVKRIHSAIPTQAGVRSALFADAGITGPHSILEGEKGFCKVFAGTYDPIRLTEDLGARYHLMDTAVKPHACPHLMHAALDALDNMRARHPFGPEQVKEITVYSTQAILSHVGSITEPHDVLGAQFSLPFSLAMRLHHGGSGVHGGNGFWDYPKVNVSDPVLLATARKVKCCVADDAAKVRLDEGFGVEIETTDGHRMMEIVRHSRGLPENPMSPDEIKEKFISLVEPVLPRGTPQQVIEKVDSIETIENIDELIRLLVVAP